MSVLAEFRQLAAGISPALPRFCSRLAGKEKAEFFRNWEILIEHVFIGRTLAAIGRDFGLSRFEAHRRATRCARKYLELLGQANAVNRKLPCSVQAEDALREIREYSEDLPVTPPDPLPTWSAAARNRFERGWPLLIDYVKRGYTLAAIGEHLGISRQRVHVIIFWTALRWFELQRKRPELPIPSHRSVTN